ncbi:MAG: hypothetical protein L0Y56_00720, partial [Nitrospira sp.]|nr:hypothetical protein [Nitrospira sp.]
FFVDAGATFDNPKAITAVSVDVNGAVVVTAPGIGLITNDQVDLTGIEWVPLVDGEFNETQPDQAEGRFTVIAIGGNSFQLSGINGIGWQPYVRGGTARKVVSTITGFDWLAGETDLVGLLDGNTFSNISVSSTGAITLPHPSSRAHIGMRFISDLETLDIESPSGETLQGHLKKINFVVVKFERTRGLLIGPDSEHLFEFKQRDDEVYGESTRLLTGDTPPIFLESAWNSNGRIFLRQRYPLPFTVLGIIPNFEIGTRDDNS